MTSQATNYISEFWALADQRSALTRELEKLTGSRGQLPGFEFLGWSSPKRKRAQLVVATLQDTNELFSRAQAAYTKQMREHAAERVVAARATYESISRIASVTAASDPAIDAGRARSRAIMALAAADRTTLRLLARGEPKR